MKYCYLLFLVIILFFTSCDKDKTCCKPLSFCEFPFRLWDSGSLLSVDSMLNDMKFYYLNENGNKVDDWSSNAQSNAPFLSKFIMNPSEEASNIFDGFYLLDFVADKDIRHWFFEYSNGILDTLYIEARRKKEEEHVCETPIELVRFNGEVVDKLEGVYDFRK